MNKALRILIIAAGLCFASAGMAAAQNVTLVRGLSFYNLEVGATGGFSFDVGADGMVTVRNPLAATGGANTLTLNHTERFSR
jgi:hypothetical protein